MRKLKTCLLVIFCVIFLGSAAYLTYYYIEQGRNRSELAELAAMVAAARPAPTAAPEVTPDVTPAGEAEPDAAPTPVPTPVGTIAPDEKPRPTPPPVSEGERENRDENGMLLQYAGLYASNPDIVGWLCVPGTVIDYPVMQTPEDQNYYLRRGWNGRYSAYGLLFVDANCDVAEGDNAIIYGHKKYDGQMFGRLTDFESESFWKQHKTFTFDTLYEERTFEVVCAFRARILYQKEEGFRYYWFYDAETEAEYDDFVTNIKEMALYDTGVTPEYGDQLVTLSTCYNWVTNGRFVVVGRLVEDAQAEGEG